MWRAWWGSVVALSLIASAVPAAAQPAAAPDDPVPLEADLDLEWGDPLAVPDELEPTCDDPPCGEVASTGAGGYIAITPAQLTARRGLRPGVIDIPVAGVGGLPEVGVGALVLNVAVRNVVDRSSITLYPPERTRPARPHLQVDATRDWSTLAVIEVATSGAVTRQLARPGRRRRGAGVSPPPIPAEVRWTRRERYGLLVAGVCLVAMVVTLALMAREPRCRDVVATWPSGRTEVIGTTCDGDFDDDSPIRVPAGPVIECRREDPLRRLPDASIGSLHLGAPCPSGAM
jgi:hypothetical protein